MDFDFQDQKVISEIEKLNAKKVLVQLPEGIKKEALRIVQTLEKTGAEIIVSGETCWGGCDVSINEAKELSVDLIVHYGHVPFREFDFKNILYIPCYDNTDLTPLLKKSLEDLKEFQKIALVSSIQHIKKLESTKKFLEENNKEVIIPNKKGVSHSGGHVLGCEFSLLKELDYDAVLVLGNRFHSLGASLAQEKNVYLVDVYNNEIKLMNELRDIIIRQRFASIEKAKQAKKIGIILGTKPGQKFGSAEILKRQLKDKEVIVLTMSEITPDKLLSFYNIEAFIELACPRIAIEDYEKYRKPILTFKEAMVLTGHYSWEELLKQGLL